MRTAGLMLCAALPLALAACGSRPVRGEEGAPKAVVLAAPYQDEISIKIAQALNLRGYDVLRKSTSIRRAQSSLAIYDVRNHPERVEDMKLLFHTELSFPIDVMPFYQHATGGNAVVVWLGPDAP